MRYAFRQDWPDEEVPKFNSRGNILLDHNWNTNSSICTRMNERPFQGKEGKRT